MLLIPDSGHSEKETTKNTPTHLQMQGQIAMLRPCPGLLGGRCVASYLLLGGFILEAGVLDVIGPDSLVLLILGAQVLHSLGDSQSTALNVLTADPVRNKQHGVSWGSWAPW